jgi:flagellar protein FliS
MEKEQNHSEANFQIQLKNITMLHDGAIHFIEKAIDQLSLDETESFHTYITKTQEIITELILSLNLEKGGKVVNDLLTVYSFIKKKLIETSIEKEKSILQDLVLQLRALRKAWETIFDKIKK